MLYYKADIYFWVLQCHEVKWNLLRYSITANVKICIHTLKGIEIVSKMHKWVEMHICLDIHEKIFMLSTGSATTSEMAFLECCMGNQQAPGGWKKMYRGNKWGAKFMCWNNCVLHFLKCCMVATSYDPTQESRALCSLCTHSHLQPPLQ